MDSTHEIALYQQDNKGEIILYQPDDSLKLEVRLDNETVWLAQIQIAKLFGVDRSVITKHLQNRRTGRKQHMCNFCTHGYIRQAALSN